jgi:2-methylcitrate dehydratase PrpD
MAVKKTAAISPLMKKLSGYIAGATRKSPPKEVVEVTKHHILDTLAAMVSGAKLLPGRVTLSYAKTLGGKPEALVVGTRLLTSTVNAALINAMLAHADETDDSHAPSWCHPGCAIVASALAMGEREHSDGTSFMRAVTLGYDVCARLNISLNPIDFRKLGHMTHCFGPTFGAAAASAALAKLDGDQVRHVLSYTAQQTGGLSTYMRDLDHIEKAFDFGGMAARNGMSATTMVASGCTGVEDVFSGERNFYMAFDESRRTGIKPDPETLVRGLGSNYEIMRTNIKRWTVGSPIQAPLDSLLELIRANNIKADDVEKLVVRVSTTGANTVNNREMPDICMQYMCAVMMLDGTATFISAHDEKRMADPKVMKVRAKIELIGDEYLQSLVPERHGIVEIKLKDGRELRHHTKAVRGTAQNPMTRPEVDEKCYDLMAPVLGKKRSRMLCDTIWNIEKVKDVRKLRPLLRA